MGPWDYAYGFTPPPPPPPAFSAQAKNPVHVRVVLFDWSRSPLPPPSPIKVEDGGTATVEDCKCTGLVLVVGHGALLRHAGLAFTGSEDRIILENGGVATTEL